jgi:hypothetical protein
MIETLKLALSELEHGDVLGEVKAASLIRALITKLEAREPAAWLHEVTSDDGDSDEALSFNADNFPFDALFGYRSIGCTPLYKD